MELVKYDAACRAVAEAKTVDEAIEISNRAEAMRAYAKQAKNRQIEIDAMEIRVRAERRLGEILLDVKRSGGVTQGRRGARDRLTLKEIGVDGNLSSISQRLALLPPKRFDAELSDWRVDAETKKRVEFPFTAYRHPYAKADRDKARLRKGLKQIAFDPLDKFRATDNRRFADWRVGEVQRQIEFAERQATIGRAILSVLPTVEDTLITVEMVVAPQRLLAILEEHYLLIALAPSPIPQRKAPVFDRTCQHCGKPFSVKPSRQGGRGLKTGRWGIYCSRSCSGRALNKSRESA